jgi:hypothetical protein
MGGRSPRPDVAFCSRRWCRRGSGRVQESAPDGGSCHRHGRGERSRRPRAVTGTGEERSDSSASRRSTERVVGRQPGIRPAVCGRRRTER